MSRARLAQLQRVPLGLERVPKGRGLCQTRVGVVGVQRGERLRVRDVRTAHEVDVGDGGIAEPHGEHARTRDVLGEDGHKDTGVLQQMAPREPHGHGAEIGSRVTWGHRVWDSCRLICFISTSVSLYFCTGPHSVYLLDVTCKGLQVDPQSRKTARQKFVQNFRFPAFCSDGNMRRGAAHWTGRMMRQVCGSACVLHRKSAPPALWLCDPSGAFRLKSRAQPPPKLNFLSPVGGGRQVEGSGVPQHTYLKMIPLSR